MLLVEGWSAVRAGSSGKTGAAAVVGTAGGGGGGSTAVTMAPDGSVPKETGWGTGPDGGTAAAPGTGGAASDGWNPEPRPRLAGTTSGSDRR